MIPARPANVVFSYAPITGEGRPFDNQVVDQIQEGRQRGDGDLSQKGFRINQEQNRAPNFTWVSGQLLSVRRTTRATRMVDFICGVSAI